VIRPPRDVPAAIWRLAIGLALIFLLGPDVRFGYFIYPFGLLGWLALTQGIGRRSRSGVLVPSQATASTKAVPSPQAAASAQAPVSVQHVVGDP
jgi:hypothetical protein